MSELLDVSSATLSGELPCGFLDESGRVHQTFIVTEMTGEEEDLLAGTGPVVPRLNRVILNCLRQLGDIDDRSKLSNAVENLVASDRMYLLIAIRRASLGNRYVVKITCSSCSAQNTAAIDLAGLEVKSMPDPSKREFSDTMPSGSTVKWHVLNGKDEVWLTKHAKSKQDRMTLAMLTRIDSITGVNGQSVVIDRNKDLNAAIANLKKMSLRDRTFMRSLFEQREGTIDTEIEYTCPSCGAAFKGELDIQQSFFFPQEI